MIKELGKGEPGTVEPRPIQVAKDNALLGFLLCEIDQTHLCAKIIPAMAVVDDSIYPCPKLRVHWLAKFLLPPQVEWEIGVQVREDDVWQLCGASAFEKK